MEKAGWPETVEIELHGLAQGGEAVGRWEGRPVFVRGGLPGERVRARLTERTPALARGELLEVLSGSQERTPPACPIYERCGGCDLQHASYTAQLAGKAQILAEQLVYLGRVADPVVLPTVASETWAYRASARIHVDGLTLGYYEPGSRAIVPLDACPLLHPLLNEAIAALQYLLPAPGLREVSLRLSLTDQALVALLKVEEQGRDQRAGGTGPGNAGNTGRRGRSDGKATGRGRQEGRSQPLVSGRQQQRATQQPVGEPETPPRWSKRAWKELARAWRSAFKPLAGVALSTREGYETLDGSALLYEDLGGLLLRISPTSFSQANPRLAQAMLEAVAEALQLEPGQRLLDAYCGIGTFVLPLARRYRLAHALGIEEHPAAVADARWAAEQSHLTAVEIVEGRVEQVLPRLPGGQRFDAAILDPPRRGADPKALEALARLRPRRIAYVSCHPGTLARDVRTLAAAGYQLRTAQPFDFFPQTAHVESLNLLEWAGE